MQLLKQAGIPFRVVTSTGDEERVQDPNPMVQALERARIKARGAVLEDYLADWSDEDAVLAADTVVAVGDEVFGKPRDEADARRMLQALSGTRHKVVTGEVVMVPAHGGQDEREACFVAFAHVTMRPLSEQDIEDYLGTGESAERSGGYAIQQTADRFVVDREGEHDTIVGLNVATVCRLYRELTGHVLPGDPEGEA